jgi:hypothetical protein
VGDKDEVVAVKAEVGDKVEAVVAVKAVVREDLGEGARVVCSPVARLDSVFAQNAVIGNHTNEVFHAPT